MYNFRKELKEIMQEDPAEMRATEFLHELTVKLKEYRSVCPDAFPMKGLEVYRMGKSIYVREYINNHTEAWDNIVSKEYADENLSNEEVEHIFKAIKSKYRISRFKFYYTEEDSFAIKP